MARYQWIVLTCAVPGREQEFDDWYDRQHIRDVCAVPGVLSARRFRIVNASIEEATIPKWQALAIYELETDGDPLELTNSIRALARTPAMPVTDAYRKPGLMLVIGEEMAAYTAQRPVL